jgi:hypothetical protein
MTSLAELESKCSLVRKWYSDLFEKGNPGGDTSLTFKESKLFNSMERFHRLSHTK